MYQRFVMVDVNRSTSGACKKLHILTLQVRNGSFERIHNIGADDFCTIVTEFTDIPMRTFPAPSMKQGPSVNRHARQLLPDKLVTVREEVSAMEAMGIMPSSKCK